MHRLRPFPGIENRVNMISPYSEFTFEQVISQSIRRASSGDKHLHLETLGRPMSVKEEANQEAPRIVSAEEATKGLKPNCPIDSFLLF